MQPARRITRKQSQADDRLQLEPGLKPPTRKKGDQEARATEQIIPEIAEMEAKRKYTITQIERVKKAIENKEVFTKWSKGELSERIKKLDDLSTNFDNFNLQLTCDGNMSQEQANENVAFDDEMMSLKAKLRDRIESLSKSENEQAQAQAQQEPLRIEVQQTDAAGNIPNTWGKFDGDYAKWQSFRDRWLAAMHTNDKVKAVTKFQNLKTACIGDAAGALGEWDLTEANYQKAWDRLQGIYEDDYMQVQAFMKKLNKLPRMKNRSSKTIRNIIDTVQKHINGLKRYVKLDEANAYAVFTVIDRMDSTTYRAWEKHRPTLVKANVQADPQPNENQNDKPGKHIPTWEQLEAFLESEVTIRVHAENRGEMDEEEEEHPVSQKKNKRFKGNKNKNQEQAYSLKCELCSEAHQLFKCEVFKAMNLNGRKKHISDHDLCEKCLRDNHSGPCRNKFSNNACPRCLPEKKYHNSMICANKELRVLLAREEQSKGNGRKRKFQNKKSGRYAKKRRFEADDRQNLGDDKVHSGVHKIGNWSLVAKESNAVKQFNKRAITNEKGELEFAVALATMKIRIQTGIDTINICRAIADTGATVNCISKQYVQENKLQTYKCQKGILGVSGPETIRNKVVAYIRPWFDSNVVIPVEFLVLQNLDGAYPSKQIVASKEQIIHLGLADEEFDKPAPIQALLGVEVYAKIIGNDIYKNENGAMMQSTSFGHIILGKFSTKKDSFNESPIFNIINDIEVENDKIVKALNKFWEIENTNKSINEMFFNDEAKAVEKIYADTYSREKNGRYVVTIPIKPECKGLGDSRNLALRQFLQLERRLEKKPELKEKYIQFMREYKSLGYLVQASESYDPKFSYWLPHHPVEKKFRVVVNASAKTTSGESLNAIQMTGGKLQYDLALQIMRFGKFQIGVATDISKMFNRIGLHPKQWNLQRLFWRESPKSKLKEYVVTVVMFGLKSSPYNAVRTLKQCARDQAEKFPKAANVIESCFYMDDGIFGCESVAEAKILCKEVEHVLNQGNFPLKGWVSNAKEIEEYMNSLAKEAVLVGGDDETKILGLIWLKATDEWTILVKNLDRQSKLTKRNILSQIASLYDPNGFIAPVIVKVKMLMQDIWRLKEINWDDKVPKQIEEEWSKFYATLPLLREFRKKRWHETKSGRTTQIHAFCDASEKAYGIAIYVRVLDEFGNIHCSLISAKSKVAPIKKVKCPKEDKVSIPRLELLAAVMLSEQLEVILEACEFQQSSVTLWSDSIVVLHWINKQHNELKAFVSNRIKIIQEKTNRFVWKHVSSADNPADLVSRGMDIPKFLKSKFWLEGPEWLKKPETAWPLTRLSISPQAKVEIGRECKQKIGISNVFMLLCPKDNTLIYNKYDNWDTIVNVTAYVQRVFRIARKEKAYSGRYLFRDERKKAMELWIKFEQEKHFKKEIDCIKLGENLPGKSKIAALRPMLDENGILRVGGRIDKANIRYEKRHQYIIPQKSRLSYLLLKYAHSMNLHGGAQQMIHFLRKSFWIPKIRQEAKHYVGTCAKCVREAQKTAQQIMAELPEVRLKPAPVFQNVGIDLAGPYNMRITDKVNMNTRTRMLPDIKGWIVVFVCLVTRAVHLEPTEGLSTEDFLAAYQRFVGRRGNPEKVYSDNGTNFVGANKELQKAYKIWQAEKIQHWVHQLGTEWHFITPSAPHEGGIWEAAVKSMKHHLRRIIGPQKYSLLGITTLLASVEACLNSRPLCALSDDPEDREALTPGHFIIGRAIRLPIYDQAYANSGSIRHFFKASQTQIQSFWHQWSEDCLQALTQLPKWRERQENLKIGQLVLIKTENIPPTYWAMGRISEIHTGADGKVRSVVLKTQSGYLERSIHKLCVLPEDIELKYWQ